AVVVAAGPLSLRVLETRLRMVAANGPTPVADEAARLLVGHGVKYQVDCDDRTQALAEETKVEVAWTEPRITIAAAEVAATGRLDALPPLAPSDDPGYQPPSCPALTLERVSEGVALRGLNNDKELPNQPWTKYRWDANGRVSFGDRAGELAQTADALMCRH